MRAHELAKKLDISFKELQEKLAAQGITIKTASNNVDAYIEVAEKIFAKPAPTPVPAVTESAPPPPPVTAPSPPSSPKPEAPKPAPAAVPGPKPPAPAPLPSAPSPVVSKAPPPLRPPPPPTRPRPSSPGPGTTMPPSKPRPSPAAAGSAPPARPRHPQAVPGAVPPSKPRHPQAIPGAVPPPRVRHPQAVPGAVPPARPTPRPPEPTVPPPSSAVPAKPREVEPAIPSATPKGRTIVLSKPTIVVKELAELLEVKPNVLIAALMKMNLLVSINERLDAKVAQQVAESLGFQVEREKKPEHVAVMAKAARPEEEEKEDRPEDLVIRPPVVAVMGHVDHGKTSLLDRIRSTSVAAGEDGGITQHIGAYTVAVGDKTITFLDTPGHEAFTAMRARGAHVTDIALIVVAADDGVMPQTEEAIRHAQAARAQDPEHTAIVVAINKVDLPSANPAQVKQQLAAIGLAPEEWGGETLCCEVSALTGQGIQNLLETLLLQAEILELKANPRRKARGVVLEAQLEPGMGPTAHLLVMNGTLHVGDILLIGPHWGRVRAMVNDKGQRVREVGPSFPVKVMGLSGVPDAGAEFRVCESEKIAREKAEEEARRLRQEQLAAPKKVSMESLYETLKEASRLVLRVLIKADVQGSVEAIRYALENLKSDKVALDIVMSGVGHVTVNDVLLAKASQAVILQFRVGKDGDVSRMAKHEGVEIRPYSIIYELVDDVRTLMAGLLPPELVERVIGHAEVKKVFALSRGTVAGCQVTDGRVTSQSRVRVKRGGESVHEGPILSLRRFQADVSEVREGQECGIRLEQFSDFREGDVLEFFEVEKKTPQL